MEVMRKRESLRCLRNWDYMHKLSELLTVAKIEDPDVWFENVARELFYSYSLLVGNTTFQIIEVELYFYSDEHQDLYTHCSNEQKDSLKWYFHKRGSGVKEGNYAGVDITFGNETRWGGILLRGLRNTQTGEVVDGSGKVAMEILKRSNLSKMNELDCFEKKNIFKAEHLKLIPFSFDHQEIYKSPRKGLFLQNNVSDRLNFITKNYRFFAGVPKTKKSKYVVAIALYLQGIDPVDLGLVSQKVFNKYLVYLKEGVQVNYSGHDSKTDEFIVRVLGALNKL